MVKPIGSPQPARTDASADVSLPRTRSTSEAQCFECTMFAIHHRMVKKASPLSMAGAIAFLKQEEYRGIAEGITVLAPTKSSGLTCDSLSTLAALTPNVRFIVLNGTEIEALPESLMGLKDLEAILCLDCQNLTADKIPEQLRGKVFLEAPELSAEDRALD